MTLGNGTDRREIQKHSVGKFKTLFNEEEVDFLENLDNLITPCITEEENIELCRVPTQSEIKKELFQMQTLKAPGPDGFPLLLYKKYWAIVGEFVTRAVTSFCQAGRMPAEVNNSFIVLIHKSQSPTSFNHYRPISLCNVVYKIITKLLVSRLRKILHKLISPTQVEFISGRWISENQIVVQEMLHSFKTRKVKFRLMAVKIDLPKAYDRVNWCFLQVVLKNFGFDEKFVQWILECVSTVSFELLINGGKTGQFRPKRGLRQGDPLSPYLFILCQEVLSRILEKEFMEKNISGVKASIGSTPITHVMYMDDIVLFSKAYRREANAINDCLEKYCRWFGQLLNRAKSGIIFSKLTHQQTCRGIKHFLQMKSLKMDSVYLGAPLFLTKAPAKDFKFLQERLEAKLKGWRSKTLSWAGRSTLIKTVAQALPTYTMSTFDIPTKVCDKLDALTRKF